MIIVVSGASGMIGSALVKELYAAGHQVKRLVRHEVTSDAEISWDPADGVMDAAGLDGCDAIINLAGENIAQRWTSAAKREIRESRVAATSLLARTVASMAVAPTVVLSGSAIGYYGNRGDELLDEGSSSGRDFLSTVVQDWEAAAMPIAAAGVRLVYLRSGLVLSKEGGALAKMLLPFKLGAGGHMGDGTQWMSWIGLHDHVNAMIHALTNQGVHGPVNFVTPHPVTNAEFASILGSVLNRPAVVPAPAFALKLMFGEMAEGTILSSQRVMPSVLSASGFRFAHPTLQSALSVLLSG
ncbi:MAG: hypothetical protein JWM95_5399 [Gemmatimonadetes bacterium]|nr:hypothetical protein [Gemmatimonadota bacterium]